MTDSLKAEFEAYLEMTESMKLHRSQWILCRNNW